MNMRSIYANPYKYAVECNIPFELAKIMCLKQRHYYKEERKHRMYCPVCKSKHLIFEGGYYEEGYGDFIECEDCGETFDCEQVPNDEKVKDLQKKYSIIEKAYIEQMTKLLAKKYKISVAEATLIWNYAYKSHSSGIYAVRGIFEDAAKLYVELLKIKE